MELQRRSGSGIGERAVARISTVPAPRAIYVPRQKKCDGSELDRITTATVHIGPTHPHERWSNTETLGKSFPIADNCEEPDTPECHASARSSRSLSCRSGDVDSRHS